MSSKIIDGLKYTKEHEWIKIDGDVATIGITDFAQDQLEDIVYVELPNVGDAATIGDPFGSVEAVKAVEDLFSPLNGEIVEVNDALSDSPETVNSDPFGEGWMVKIKMSDPGEANSLMSSDDYKSLTE